MARNSSISKRDAPIEREMTDQLANVTQNGHASSFIMQLMSARAEFLFR